MILVMYRMAHKAITSRWCHHVVLAGISLVIYGLASSVVAGPTVLDVLSIASAYICLILMVAALSIGPWRVLHSKSPQANILLRRDTGIWAAVAGLVHLVVATRLSMTSHYMNMYVDVSTEGLAAPLRASLFLWGSVVAYIVGVLLLLLLSLSNNASMRLLGKPWWKRLQRSAYAAFVLTIAHGLAFQLLESRDAWMLLLIASTLLLAGFQLLGVMSVTGWRK